MKHRIALISDIHFGVKNNSEKFLEIQEYFFRNTLLEYLIKENITDLRILGDLFDNRNNINVRTLNAVLGIVRYFHQKFPKLHIKILNGNHDNYYHNRIDVNSLEILRDMPNVTIIDKVTTETINGKSIVTFPWIVKDSEVDIKFKEFTKGTTKYDLCLGHFEVNGFEVVPGQTYKEGVELGLFKNFKRVFTGHFHLRNTIGNLSYLGCPYQITWSDYGDPKGIHIYNLDTNETTFIENTHSPVHIKINFEDLINKNLVLIKKVKGNYVKLVIDKKYDDSVILKGISKLEELSPLKLDIENNFIEEINGESIGIDPSKLSNPIEFLNEFINLTDFDASINKDKLIAYVAQLYNNVKE